MAGDATSYPKVEFRLGTLTSHVLVRTPGHTSSHAREQVQADLGRYYQLLADELLMVSLTAQEAHFCCDVVGPTPRHRSPADVIVTILDALRRPIPPPARGVDGAALRQKIVDWTPGQRCAVVDAIERWWCLPRPEREADSALADVGLVQAETGPGDPSTFGPAGPPG